MGKKKQMRSEVKGNVKNSIGRIVFAALAVLLQIGWILILMIKLYQYSSVISLLTSLFALVVALRIYGKHTNAAFKMPWIIVILAFPVFGLCIYGLFGHKEAMHKIIRGGVLVPGCELESKGREEAHLRKILRNYGEKAGDRQQGRS